MKSRVTALELFGSRTPTGATRLLSSSWSIGGKRATPSRVLFSKDERASPLFPAVLPDPEARKATNMSKLYDAPTELTRYMDHAQSIPRLSREEEHALALRVRDHADRHAADKLVNANLRYVVAIALRYRRYGLPVGDLISEGNVGLMMALGKFDPERGTRFVTYAAHWIRALILDHVIKSHSLVGVGSGPLRSKMFFKLRREKAKILALTSDTADVNAQLAKKLGVTPEKVALLGERLEARDVSLDLPAREDGTQSVVDTLASGLPSQEDRFSDAERAGKLSSSVAEAVKDLDARERFIVEVRIMADGADELSLAEIGRRLGVSRERARQLEARARAKLKKRLGQTAVELAFENEAA
jgi:RNA polymerase sigma-32 factor